MYKYLVAVGSNLGDKRAVVQKAMLLLNERGVDITSESELVETTPMGAADQLFLNGVFVCSGSIPPDDFMRLLLDIEHSLGRVRDVRWGNRVIDLDVLLIRDENDHSIEWNTSVLTVPHPRMLERDFMLRPAAAVAGHWELPQSDQNLRSLCVSRGWRPTWNNLQGDIKLWQALKGDVYSATTSRWWWPTIIFMLALRLFVSAYIPYGNDEAYYWDWGRVPQASYFDHPPFVAWISLASRLLVFSWTEGPLQGRFLVPFLHLLTTLFFGALVVRLTRRVLTNLESRAVLVISQLIPAFSLGGFMLMPDIGLILFSTIAVWLVLAVSRRSHLTWWNGCLIGLFLGLCGLSKYHAIFIGGGLVGWLFWKRQNSFNSERQYWFCMILTGLLTILPVLWWNGTHDWASFKYQGARGVSGGGFEVMRAVRVLVGEILFVGPSYVICFWMMWRNKTGFWRNESAAILCSSLPMLFVLKLFSFTTQTLPHWSMPSFWLLSTLLVPTLAGSRALRWNARFYGLLLCLGLPLFMSSKDLRRSMLRWTGDRPGGLGELTLWDEASRDMEFLNWVQDRSWIEQSLKGQKLTDIKCARGLVYAAPRWFTVAQVAANLPGHPVVENLDPDHKSYYYFRPKIETSGCPVVVFSELSHWREDGWSEIEEIEEQREFEIPGHRDRRVVVARGWYKISEK